MSQHQGPRGAALTPVLKLMCTFIYNIEGVYDIAYKWQSSFLPFVEKISLYVISSNTEIDAKLAEIYSKFKQHAGDSIDQNIIVVNSLELVPHDYIAMKLPEKPQIQKAIELTIVREKRKKTA